MSATSMSSGGPRPAGTQAVHWKRFETPSEDPDIRSCGEPAMLSSMFIHGIEGASNTSGDIARSR